MDQNQDNQWTQEDILKMFHQAENFATLREFKGISNEQLELIYSIGVEAYRSGNYEDAEKVFKFLVTFEHTSSRFWAAYGSLKQAQKNYDHAIKFYQMASFLDLHNPSPMYYAAECFFKTGDIQNASLALASLEHYAPKDTEKGKRFLTKGAQLKKMIEAKNGKAA